MAYLLKKEDFPVFVKLLAKSYDIYAPVKRNGLIVYAQITDPGEIVLSKNSFYPPKKVLFPAQEELMQFRRKKTLLRTEKDVALPVYDTRKKVLLGVRMCDVSAIRKLDRFLLTDEKDPNYAERRDNTFIVALRCDSEENDNCFCNSFEVKDEGYDLYLERCEEGFLVDVKTEKGKGLIDKKVFKASQKEVTKGLPECRMTMSTKETPPVSPGWERSSQRCLSCCGCIIVCPTCSCFDIRDLPLLDLSSGSRERLWDYCQSRDFTTIAGGHISRKGRTERFRHRLLCKFKYFPEKIGEITCTGCGRCVTVCPTKVCDIPKILSGL
jgi:sulfhydrogenase subunit beta (sulfur reductase)